MEDKVKVKYCYEAVLRYILSGRIQSDAVTQWAAEMPSGGVLSGHQGEYEAQQRHKNQMLQPIKMLLTARQNGSWVGLFVCFIVDYDVYFYCAHTVPPSAPPSSNETGKAARPMWLISVQDSELNFAPWAGARGRGRGALPYLPTSCCVFNIRLVRLQCDVLINMSSWRAIKSCT